MMTKPPPPQMPPRRSCLRNKLHASAFSLVSSLGISACATSWDAVVEEPYDAVVIPGCPLSDEGALSACLKRRITWGKIVWDRNWAKRIITSGSAAYTPYIEAEGIALGLAALGVPADRIFIEANALHTDENVYYAMRIAQKMKWSKMAIASDPGQAEAACLFLDSWNQNCRALKLHPRTVTRIMQHRYEDILDRVVVPIVNTPQNWQNLRAVEKARADAGGIKRPASFVLYPTMRIRRALGKTWIPPPPPSDDVVSLEQRFNLETMERKPRFKTDGGE